MTAAQGNHSNPFQDARESQLAPMFIIIDHSSAVYNTYHHSQNQTNTETINSNNNSSTNAHNSSLNGDSGSTFRTEGLPETPRRPHRSAPARYSYASGTGDSHIPPHSPAFGQGLRGYYLDQLEAFSFILGAILGANQRSATYSGRSDGQRRHNSWPMPSSSLAGFHSPRFEGSVTLQPLGRDPPPSHSSRGPTRENATGGLPQHTPPANGLMARLPIFIQWLLAWFKEFPWTSRFSLRFGQN